MLRSLSTRLKAEAEKEANPEADVPPASEPDADEKTTDESAPVETEWEVVPDLPKPIQKDTLMREGQDIDSILAAIFKCISSFSGSFPAAPPSPPLDVNGDIEESYVAPDNERPFLWEAVYPQNQAGKPVYNPAGKYIVKVFLAGKWRMLEVDDTIPVGEYDEPLILTSGIVGELWPTILAKAVYLLWDKVGGRSKVAGDVDGSLELAKTANFAAFTFYTLTGWLPQGIMESVDVDKLTSFGMELGEVTDFMVHVPNPDDDNLGYQRDSPKKKLGKILSPKKKVSTESVFCVHRRCF